MATAILTVSVGQSISITAGSMVAPPGTGAVLESYILILISKESNVFLTGLL